MITAAFRDQMARMIQYVRPVPYSAATGLTAEVYRQMQADFMPAPLLALHSPAPGLLAGAWGMLRETLLAGRAERAHKEVVAAVVSQINACPFCIDAHTLMLHATDEHDVAGAILRGDYAGIRDPQLRALAEWLLAGSSAHLDGAPVLPFSAGHAPEMIGTAVAFHYLNRMANLFLGDGLVPLPASLKGLTGRLFAALGGKQVVRRLEPGRSLAWIPHAELPDDLAWAAENPAVAGALAGFAALVEEAGRAALPEPVRDLVRRRIGAWSGEDPGLGRGWVEEAAAGLAEPHRAAARLALLAALASYQVDAGIVMDFQAHYPGDAQLIGAAAWASFAAARRAGTWIADPFTRIVEER
jgi:AhpD family alkylhydroperoxidase